MLAFAHPKQPADVAALSPMQEQAALHTLTLAYQRDPPCRWLNDRPRRRQSVFSIKSIGVIGIIGRIGPCTSAYAPYAFADGSGSRRR